MMEDAGRVKDFVSFPSGIDQRNDEAWGVQDSFA